MPQHTRCIPTAIRSSAGFRTLSARPAAEQQAYYREDYHPNNATSGSQLVTLKPIEFWTK